MRAYELQQTFGVDSLRIVDRPRPEPGPSQILLELHAWSLNYRDLLMVKGLYNPKLRLPHTPLSDCVGRVIAVGESVTGVRIGERVAAIFAQKWIDGGLTEAKAKSALGGELPGVAAEYALLDACGVVTVSEHLTDEEAATLPCAALTAWNALVSSGGIQAGQTVLTQGTGGVSLFALQFARALGASVIATSGSEAKLARLSQLGASHVLDYKATPQWGDRARELTAGLGVDHVVEVGGAGTMDQSLRAVRYGGRISLIGVLSPGRFNHVPILMKGVCVQGVFVGSRTMFEAMNAFVTEHRLRPVVDRVFSFAELPDALHYMESGAHFGKIVLRR